MANSSNVTAGSAATAAQYNNLRADVLNTSTGHTHNGVDSRTITLADNSVYGDIITDEGISDVKLGFDRWKVIVYSATVSDYIWTMPTTGTKQFRIICGGGARVTFLDTGGSDLSINYVLWSNGGTAVQQSTSSTTFCDGSLIEITIDKSNNFATLYATSTGSLKIYGIALGLTAKLKFLGSNLIIEELIGV